MNPADLHRTPDGRIYVLRTCRADGTSRGGFRWPETGVVEAPDWDPDPGRDCGGGLHGLAWGQGDATLFNWGSDARWLVVAVDPTDGWVPSDGKVRFRRGEVVHAGTLPDAIAILRAAGWTGVLPGDTATAGYRGTAVAGYRGTATAGNLGTATASYYGTATAGYQGTATAGDYGTATAGHEGTATAGYLGTATAGNGGTAITGNGGTATAGLRGTATAGYEGIIQIRWWDGIRDRLAVGYIGEEGLQPGVPYRVEGAGRFVRAEEA